MLMHAFLDGDDCIGRYRYIPPKILLVPDVRRKHVDMRDGGTEAGGSKQEDVSLKHTLWFLLYR